MSIRMENMGEVNLFMMKRKYSTYDIHSYIFKALKLLGFSHSVLCILSK